MRKSSSAVARMLRKFIVLALIVAFSGLPLAEASVSSGEVMYVGGTIPKLPEGTMGKLETSSDKVLVFTSPKGRFEIPYEEVTSLEYGQKAGRRLGVALTISIWALLSKKRKHFLTIGFNDANEKPQGVVLEIPKGTAKTYITIIEVRSGKKVEYESEEAKKHVHG